MKTIEEAFSYAVDKIVEQGVRCITPDANAIDMCAYSDSYGNHCAIGWLLDHENYDFSRAIGGVETLVDRYGDMVPAVIVNNIDAFSLLQQFHDCEYRYERLQLLHDLRDCYGDEVDFSNPNWMKWVDMGDE